MKNLTLILILSLSLNAFAENTKFSKAERWLVNSRNDIYFYVMDKYLDMSMCPSARVIAIRPDRSIHGSTLQRDAKTAALCDWTFQVTGTCGCYGKCIDAKSIIITPGKKCRYATKQ